jgi:hypothetical protein
MALGEQRLGTGEVVDFDLLYHDWIVPAADALGLTAARADNLVSTGTNQRALIEAIARSDVMIADLSVGGPNVIYELGLRHGLRPRTTVLLTAAGSTPLFDAAMLRVVTYDPHDASTTDGLRRLQDLLIDALRDSLASSAADSPFFQYFPVEPVELPGSSMPGEQVRRDLVETMRTRLLEARQVLPEQGVPRLQHLERDLATAGLDDDRLRTDLMLAYRDCAAWDDTIRVIAGFPDHLRQSPVVVQQNALAHNRRGRPGDADRAASALQGLLDRLGPDSETYGLLGRIHKDRYQSTGDQQHLFAAIDAYRRGWQADPDDVYPGINLATLLTIAGDAGQEEAREVARHLRATLEQRIQSGPVDYWDLATRLELTTIDRDWQSARTLVSETRARAAAGWMLETTSNNLRILADAMADPEDRREIRRLIRSFAPEVAAP